MAELVLRLRVDPVTGRREVVVDYCSDADALPMEHEDEHRRLAGAIVEGGLASERVAVSREPEAGAAGAEAAPGEAAPAAEGGARPLPARG